MFWFIATFNFSINWDFRTQKSTQHPRAPAAAGWRATRGARGGGTPATRPPQAPCPRCVNVLTGWWDAAGARAHARARAPAGWRPAQGSRGGGTPAARQASAPPHGCSPVTCSSHAHMWNYSVPVEVVPHTQVIYTTRCLKSSFLQNLYYQKLALIYLVFDEFQNPVYRVKGLSLDKPSTKNFNKKPKISLFLFLHQDYFC